MARDLLVLIELAPPSLARLEAAGFTLHLALTAQERAQAIRTLGPKVQGVLTNGSTGLAAAGRSICS